MGIIKVYVQAKEKESLEIAKETEKIYLSENWVLDGSFYIFENGSQ